MKQLEKKLYKNAILNSRLNRLSMEDKKKIITKLLIGKSERELGEELGISHSVIHDWKTGRQDNTGANIHISMATITRKLKEFKPKNAVDYMFLESIKKIVMEKLNENKNNET